MAVGRDQSDLLAVMAQGQLKNSYAAHAAFEPSAASAQIWQARTGRARRRSAAHRTRAGRLQVSEAVPGNLTADSSQRYLWCCETSCVCDGEPLEVLQAAGYSAADCQALWRLHR